MSVRTGQQSILKFTISNHGPLKVQKIKIVTWNISWYLDVRSTKNWKVEGSLFLWSISRFSFATELHNYFLRHFLVFLKGWKCVLPFVTVNFNTQMFPCSGNRDCNKLRMILGISSWFPFFLSIFVPWCKWPCWCILTKLSAHENHPVAFVENHLRTGVKLAYVSFV